MTVSLTENDVEAVFNRLRTVSANKVCFDCGAKNPTWCSVTYGVFICIDCSAVHRGLGVHLTFVRSTQLDRNWTWLQLRQMQLGGNSNAMQFFNKHNCTSTEAQKKYSSKAASLYREKLAQMANSSLQTNQNQLHLTNTDWSEPDQNPDFFQEQEQFTFPSNNNNDNNTHLQQPITTNNTTNNNTGSGPTIHDAIPDPTRKSTILTQTKKSTVKKSGLGATKVKTNFADVEKEAVLAEELRLRTMEENAKMAALSAQEEEQRAASVRFAYRDLDNVQQKREQEYRTQDPKKAEQLERLGMGFGARGGVSHSAINDMQLIEQENVTQSNATTSSNSSTLNNLGKLRLNEICDGFFDTDNDNTATVFAQLLNINRSPASNNNSNKNADKYYGYADARNKSDDDTNNWVLIDEQPANCNNTTSNSSYNNNNTSSSTGQRSKKSINTNTANLDTDQAQKKFGNAKSISSDQYFDAHASESYEARANLSRFQGSASISSAELFGTAEKTPQRTNTAAYVTNALQNYDLDDVRESVRTGVTKVAGKLSSLANGVMSQIQDRYGY